jgi:hypothetical protein
MVAPINSATPRAPPIRKAQATAAERRLERGRVRV